MYCEPEEIDSHPELVRFRTELFDAFARSLGGPVDIQSDRIQWWGIRNETRFAFRVGVLKPNWRGERAASLGINTGAAAQSELLKRVVEGGEFVSSGETPSIWRLNVACTQLEAVSIAEWLAKVARLHVEGAGLVPDAPVDFGRADLQRLVQIPEDSAGWQLWSAQWHWASRKDDPLGR